MSSAPVNRRYTPQEYLALERRAAFKSEYLDGQIFAMAGASRAHNLVTGNIGRLLGTQLRDRECEVYASDMRVCVSETGLYTYPDVVAVCGTPEFQDDELDVLLNPTLIVEVLSPSTQSYDRTKKFDHYRSLESLQEYVLVSQDEVRVERFTRSGGAWSMSVSSRLGETVRLSSIGCDVPLNEIYAKVAFPEGSSARPNHGETSV
jgi:Uma2 family endonuclease